MSSLLYERLVVGPLQTNCYLIRDRSAHSGVIVDPGGDADLIEARVRALGMRVETILATHGHPDHVFAAGALARILGVGIAMHEADVPILQQSLPIAEMFYDMRLFESFTPDRFLREGDVVPVGGSKLRVLHTPGHSPGGICFLADDAVFCGDVLFAGSVGRTDLPGGSFEQLTDSLRDRVMCLNDAIVVYPGHGPQTTIGAERRSNPFLTHL